MLRFRLQASIALVAISELLIVRVCAQPYAPLWGQCTSLSINHI